MKTFTSVLVVAFAALIMAAAPSAHAADPIKIAVVDIQSLLKNSKGAQSIETQIAALRKSFQAEVEKEEKDLRAKENALIAQKDKLKEDELKTKAQEFQKQIAAGQKKVQERKASLDKSIATALGTLRSEIVKIVAKIGEDKDLDLVLARTDVVIVNKDMDITADVLKQLDSNLPSVKVQ